MNHMIEQRHRDAAEEIHRQRWINGETEEEQIHLIAKWLANAFPSNAWIAVTPETMPTNCESVLLLKEGSVEEGHWNADSPEDYHWWANASDDWYVDDIVTHWMPVPPLPLPPSQKEGNKL